MKLDWPCKFKGCKEKLNEDNNHINEKYCAIHKIIQLKQRQKKQAQRRSEKRRLEKRLTEKCQLCGRGLGDWQSKFCSKTCQNKAISLRRKKDRATNSIKLLAKKMIRLVEMID